MTTNLKVQLCDACRFDGGWHYDDDGHASRPHHNQARILAEAHLLSAAAHEKAMDAAKQIVREAARRFGTFSANDVRDEMDAAGVPKGCIGAAFTAVGREKDSPIRHTGRHEMSSEQSTRHRIGMWQSLVYSGSVAS